MATCHSRRSGATDRGVWPFHPDRSPSFYVSPERQTYHCFGCGVGGNAVSFVMEREKLAFPEAVRFLGKRLGIEVEEDQPGRHTEAYEACEQAARFFEQQFRAHEGALRYLVGREIAPKWSGGSGSATHRRGPDCGRGEEAQLAARWPVAAGCLSTGGTARWTTSTTGSCSRSSVLRARSPGSERPSAR